MRIFITGGTGFLGNHVVRELKAKGHDLLLLSRVARSRDGVRCVVGNMANVSAWEKELKVFKPEIAIHLAWEDIPKNDKETCVKNLVGGLNCLRAFGEAGCETVLVAGSDQEYGQTGKKKNEKSPLKPHNMLFAAKAALYLMGTQIAEQYKMNFLWARIFFVYGPGQRSKALIPYLANSLRAGAVPEIKNPYGANDFIYIDDVVRAIRMLVGRKPKSSNEIYNIGSGKLTPTAEVIREVFSFFKKPVPFFPPKAKMQVVLKGSYADIAKIKKDTGWKPKVSVKTGIIKMLSELMKQDIPQS
ncbi:MAG: hypothetical protein A3B25_03250 [Candidatus Ryanbacteria bacterium RIFCSPLOWO2_01_FULL_48_26]|uniref:NAD-dependent epimerase/dehydratase domain-containing protein n=1 Tax=Candidatus Ryanbacteria bacterium RIFCSPLOWO2_01_FULL_48_26 TaxID=1802126 RepID=A0A1G2GSF1_9BACT|nr:MAG: hypothetical protein A3B25_03250 [Candidatus Ryanbacteria bacterium RIFCSPLOWO2_01_FULL_48_26]OHB20886.1 MAG: hypothetical protein A3J67_03595 [Parcubacteria group bacterium RIFCSPHIGHO2_02_FULL_48_10b]